VVRVSRRDAAGPQGKNEDQAEERESRRNVPIVESSRHRRQEEAQNREREDEDELRALPAPQESSHETDDSRDEKDTDQRGRQVHVTLV